MQQSIKTSCNIVRAFKVPNLFQLNPDYVCVTRGNGCPWIDGAWLSGPFYVISNSDPDTELSLNKEIGFGYS